MKHCNIETETDESTVHIYIKADCNLVVNINGKKKSYKTKASKMSRKYAVDKRFYVAPSSDNQSEFDGDSEKFVITFTDKNLPKKTESHLIITSDEFNRGK